MVKIMSVNAGSSSLKFQLIKMPEETVITSGIIERIGFDDANFVIKVNGEKKTKTLPIKDHQVAVNLLLEGLIENGIVNSLDEIDGVGHRVVHGGEYFQESAVVNDDVIKKIEELSDLAPLHNPANLTGYKAFKEALPHAGQVVVFDTAFHQTMEESTFLYPLPYEYYQQYKIRKYGFHGTSHQFVSQRAIELLGNPSKSKIITCHLGNGASLAAVENGKSINTSMGFTPLSGVMMGTRTGDIDPAITSFLVEKTGMRSSEVNDLYNKKSGMLGVSGISSDARDIDDAFTAGNPRAILTRKMYAKSVAHMIGSYFIDLGGLDAIVFTAGLGENDIAVRKEIIEEASLALGIDLDLELNNVRGQEKEISTPNSKVKIFVIPTNEELVIARDTKKLLNL